jgi:hypothetical protein
MMHYRIVISHGQTGYIPKFLDVFGTDSNILFVFDAMTDADLHLVQSAGIPYVCVLNEGNRPLNRNTGLRYWEQNAAMRDDDVIEFFDGDRVPVQYLPDSVPDDWDVLLYTCENDRRLEKLKIGKVTTNVLCNPFYSCGFAMKYGAVKKIYGMNDGRLFDESFTQWGCEDQYLGVMCGRAGMNIYLHDGVILSGKVGGDELSHPKYRESLQHYVNRLLEKNIFPHIS